MKIKMLLNLGKAELRKHRELESVETKKFFEGAVIDTTVKIGNCLVGLNLAECLDQPKLKPDKEAKPESSSELGDGSVEKAEQDLRDHKERESKPKRGRSKKKTEESESVVGSDDDLFNS